MMLRERLAFDQADVASARTFGGFLDLELDSLPFPQELEDGAANRAAVEEVLDSALVANEAEPLVDQQASDGTRRHTRVLREHSPGAIPRATSLTRDRAGRERPASRRGADLPIFPHRAPGPRMR